MENTQAGAPSTTPTSSAPSQTSTPSQSTQPNQSTENRNPQPSNFGQSTPPSQQLKSDITSTPQPGEESGSQVEGQEQPNVEQKAIQELFKLKVDGVEEETTRDEVIRRAQLYTAADKRFQEAAKMRQESENLLTRLVENPKEILTHEALKSRGFDVRKFCEDYLYEQLQQEQMSPEQRQAMQDREELERYRQQDQERKQQEEQRTKETIRKQYAAKIEQEIIGSLQTSGLPVTNETVGRMAFYLKQYADKGEKNPPMDLIVDAVRRDYQTMVKRLFQQSDANTLTKILGNEVVEKIRKADIEKIKQGIPQVPAKPAETAIATGQSAKPTKHYKTMDEAKAEIERRLNS